LWAGGRVCCLRGQARTPRAGWRLLSVHGRWHDPRVRRADQAISKRLVREATTRGPSPLARLFVAVRDRLRPAWRRPQTGRWRPWPARCLRALSAPAPPLPAGGPRSRRTAGFDLRRPRGSRCS